MHTINRLPALAGMESYRKNEEPKSTLDTDLVCTAG